MQYMTGPIYMEGRENPEAGKDAKENRSVKRAFSENVNAGRTGEIWDMDMRERFRRHLVEEEKSSATVEKYLRDVRHFFRYVKEQPAARQEVTKEQVISWKEELDRSNILHDMKKLCRKHKWRKAKYFHTISGISLPVPTITGRKTSPIWRIFSDIPTSTRPASTHRKAGKKNLVCYRSWDWYYSRRDMTAADRAQRAKKYPIMFIMR